MMDTDDQDFKSDIAVKPEPVTPVKQAPVGSEDEFDGVPVKNEPSIEESDEDDKPLVCDLWVHYQGWSILCKFILVHHDQ